MSDWNNVYYKAGLQPFGWAEQDPVACPGCGEVTLYPQNGNHPMWECDANVGGCGKEVQFGDGDVYPHQKYHDYWA
jgi:hypothetical protein